MSVCSSCVVVFFKSPISLRCFTFFVVVVILFVLSVIKKGVSKSLNVIVDLSIFPCSFISFYLMHFESLLLGSYTFKIAMSSINWDCYHYEMTLFIPSNIFTMKSTVSNINTATLAFFWLVLAWHIFTILLLLTYFCLYI